MNRAVFLDKDGTLIKDVPYNVDPRLIEISDNALNGLRLLKRAGFLLVLITNQSGIARGYFDVIQLKQCLVSLESKLNKTDIKLDGIYFCPHHPNGSHPAYSRECKCRKPNPGMVLQAKEDLNIDLVGSWLIGDSLTDMETGRQAGCRNILLTTTDSDNIRNEVDKTWTVASCIDEAAAIILESKH